MHATTDSVSTAAVNFVWQAVMSRAGVQVGANAAHEVDANAETQVVATVALSHALIATWLLVSQASNSAGKVARHSWIAFATGAL